MSEMTVLINARPFQIMCADDEENQVMQLAEDLAARVADIKKEVRRVGDSHLLVLAGLTLCNELRDVQREIAEIKVDIDKAGVAREAINERMSDMEDTVGEALTLAAEKVEAMLTK